MHHVCDVHEWLTPIHPGVATWCPHEALPDPGEEGQNEPHVPDSPAHKALCKVDFDDTFLKNIPYYLKLSYANSVKL